MPAHTVRHLSQALNIEDLRTLARRKVPAFAFSYVESGAEDHATLEHNREVFKGLRMIPRQLRDMSEIDTTTQYFNRPVSLPFAICPTGYNGMLSRHGDLKLAKAARKFGIPFIQSTMSTSSIEAVAAELQGNEHWFQLYVLKDRAISQRLMRRAADAGCETLVITTDSVIIGNREDDRRNFVRPQVLTLAKKLNVALHPRWALDVLWPDGVPIFGNLTEFLPKDQWSTAGGAHFISQQMERALDWKRIDEIREDWSGKLVIKGLLHPQDIALALKHGADGVILSNHGGRQLDGSVSPMEQLPAIVERFASQCEIFLDSGFRRGSDVAKALALGARGAFLGRATLYGLAAGGQQGVETALRMLSNELETCMGQLGCANVHDLMATQMIVPSAPSLKHSLEDA
ncbi:alpha-hydroxy acid oxidase [Pacificibacter marinus]|uniref:(S)-mandelate dehydrogenase n=1 Tax=Pacificibacter marinus TaxID=658057 RepID=A0A1Y5RW37_9RHOB|nr:alpha-hydroxy acid oxidase [Pacificibacter marinus]SEK39389.1 (S)-mandelate dehydrogenase [Pacificibacter marinus]SLN25474.1 (S)-mandelate dehydrogenase [Pacificibacter marinus]